MQAYGSRISAIATVLAIVALCAGGGMTVNAQYIYDNYYPPTPPQGPPLAGPGSKEITIDSLITHHVDENGIHDGVYDRIDRAVRDNNRCYFAASCFSDEGIDDNDKCLWGCMKNGVWIPRPDHGAMITATKTRYSPVLAQTLYPDRPNDNVAKITYFVTYNLSRIYGCSGGVCFEYPWSRTVSQSIHVYVSCAEWHTGNGDLNLKTVLSEPYMDPDHSWSEDIIGGIAFANLIPNYVDSRIRASLSSFGGGESKSLEKPCNRLGVTSFPDNPQLEYISFNYVYVSSRFHLATPQITVRVTQVRRLMLHDLSGNVVRYDTETPMLEFYVGYSQIVLTMPPMLEGQAYFPTANAEITLPAPSSGQLFLIASMRDLNHDVRDPTFVVLDKNSNWGNSTQRLNTPKIWSERDPFLKKPLLMRAPGYEVTVQIIGTGPTVTTRTFTAF